MSTDVIRARSKLAGLYTYGRTPDPDTEREARRELNYAKFRRAADEAGPACMDPVQTAHVVALLIGGTDPEACERLARAVREAAYSVPTLTADDRATVAAELGGAS